MTRLAGPDQYLHYRVDPYRYPPPARRGRIAGLMARAQAWLDRTVNPRPDGPALWRAWPVPSSPIHVHVSLIDNATDALDAAAEAVDAWQLDRAHRRPYDWHRDGAEVLRR